MKFFLVLIMSLTTFIARSQNNLKSTLPETDTLNKHFVRFLCMGDLKLGDPSISISLGNIPPPSVLNEPVVTSVYCTERNQVVDTHTYLTVKNYILRHQYELKGDKREQDEYGFLLIIDIDFKYRYFIQAKKTKDFLANLIKYLKRKGIADKMIGLDNIEYIAETQMLTNGTQKGDPN